MLIDWFSEEVDEEEYGKMDSSRIISREIKSLLEDKDKHLYPR